MKNAINARNTNFADRALVYLSFSDDFVVIRTYSPVHGRSNRFYTPVIRLSELVYGDKHSFCDVDCGSTLVISRIANGNFRFSINWTSILFDDTLHGYNQTFVIPAATLEDLIDSRCDLRLLVDVHQRHTHSPVIINESAHRLIAKLSPVERRALVKALRKEDFTMAIDVYQLVTDRIIEALEQGVIPWQKEELVAEIGAAYLVNHVGLETSSSFRNSAAYIQSWLRELKNDKRLIVSAAGKAEKAVQLILGDAIDDPEE